jgi:lysophospholipase L1-like esterase
MKTIDELIQNDVDVLVWENELNEIVAKYNDDLPQNHVIFTGSSSIRLWESLKQDMSPLDVLNHGFGGSKLYDSIYYMDKLVSDFNPKAVVVFAGSNDITGHDDTKNAEDAFILGKELFLKYREKMPETKLYFISINLCNSRPTVFDEQIKFNEMMKEFLETQEDMTYIETYKVFLDDSNIPNDDFFIEDQLHLNLEGYKLWTSIIKPVLLEDLL